MPWTMKNYPDSLKNFDELTRKKVIDIANAMIADGYDEDKAIPIATAQAKKWMKSASQEELDDLENMKLKPHRAKPGLSGARLMDDNVVVQYSAEKKEWEVISAGAKQADSYHPTKAAATARAKEIAGKRGTKVVSRKKES